MAIKPDVVIAGAGPAGSTAGYLSRAWAFESCCSRRASFRATGLANR